MRARGGNGRITERPYFIQLNGTVHQGALLLWMHINVSKLPQHEYG